MFGQETGKESTATSLEMPSFKPIPYQDPLDVFSRLTNNFAYLYLLESVEGPKKLAEFSFIGFNPKKIISVKNGTTEITGGTDRSTIKTNDPLEAIKKIVSANRIPQNRFRLIGGAVGYISYDAVRYWEDIAHNSVDDLNIPDVEMGIYDDGIVFDHTERQAYYYFLNTNRFYEIERRLQEPPPNETKLLRFSEPKLNVCKEEFKKSVKQAKQYIFDGDIFQVVLSKRYRFDLSGNVLNFYRVLRQINPSPYMYFLKYGKRQIVGSSPEMLVRVENNLIETYPIAGTRPIVDDPKKNRELREELLADPKERAEHIMLVDLARNDVGRIAYHGSVTVPELMTVNQYSHVQHIVSRVTGRLPPNHDCFDSLRVMLPAGTVTGAPKVRAMQIIDDLEPTRRGPYAGAVGYFSYNRNADFAITIRTLVADGDIAYIQAGGGIVADSDPEREWFETENKAEALIKSLNQAGEKT